MPEMRQEDMVQEGFVKEWHLNGFQCVDLGIKDSDLMGMTKKLEIKNS